MKPTIRRYKKGSIIYFSGDIEDKIYILRSGGVVLLRHDYVPEFEDGKIKGIFIIEKKDIVKSGEFFGVKSAIGKFPREETAAVYLDSEVIVLNTKNFEELVIKKVDIGLKLLVSLSKQLRQIGEKLKHLLGGETIGVHDEEMLKIAEFYRQKGKINYAKHILNALIKSYPKSPKVREAKKLLAEITGEDIPIEDDFEEQKEEKQPEDDIFSNDFDLDFGDEEDQEPGLGNIDIPREFLTNPEYNRGDIAKLDTDEIDFMDEFLNPRKPKEEEVLEKLEEEEFDIFGEDNKEENDPANEPQGITEMFYTATGLFAQGEYKKAEELFKKIIESHSVKDNERELVEKSYIELARTYIKQNRCPEAIKLLANFLKKFPKTHEVKNAYYYIGLGYECLRKFNEAYKYYSKVEKMPPKEDINRMARDRIKKIQDKLR